jgi:hypothetical protein
MQFNYEEALNGLAKKVAKNPDYLKHLEKALDPTLYRGLLVWIELDRTEGILNSTKGLDVSDPATQKRVNDALIRVTAIHEQVGAEISDMAESNNK